MFHIGSNKDLFFEKKKETSLNLICNASFAVCDNILLFVKETVLKKVAKVVK